MDEVKARLQQKFSKDYEQYYAVDLFKRKGFVRKKCENCGKHFWTLDANRTRCDDQPCSPYTFIGDAPTKTKLDYISTWKKVEEFFRSKGHAIIPRYPVVARWRPDLYFTVASIIDFQRIEGGKVVFELPTNPLVVPQMCLRFNDLATVGVNGKHNSSFCMIGQTAIANKEGYWKDRCIDLDFELLTKVLGIPEEEVSFIEGVWVGYGAFGYCMDYFARGLELGNAVFTAFEGDLTNYSEMKEKVIDMGSGLERLAWITQGTPTSYDVTFESVLKRMREVSPVHYDHDLFLRYSRVAGALNVDDYPDLSEARKMIAKTIGVPATDLTEKLAPVEALYAVADHSRTLLFAIADGLLPSNVGGGYNLRVVFRRAQSFIQRYGFKFDLVDTINWHIDQLREMFPELEQHRGDVSEVLEVEASRYASSMERVSKTISSLSGSKKQLGTDDLVRLYDSDGITPEQLVQAGLNVVVPDDFYQRVVSKHVLQKAEDKGPKYDTSDVPNTRLLYYEDADLFEFDARVLKVYEDGFVALDQTAFYPRGGGQEPDHGTLDGKKVEDATKYGGVVLHKLEGRPPLAGSTVHGIVDSVRRQRIKRIHTATHILNGASRQVLGPWVWQHSAFKEANYGRLDITHFAHLSDAEIQKIEDVANDIVMRNLPVTISNVPRRIAEEKYGFRIFQGGVVPSGVLRIVNISDWDIQACGGTHTKTTGEVGLIKIVKTERIQDGVERLDFVAGYPAVTYVQEMYSMIGRSSSVLGTQRENIVRVAEELKQKLEETSKREKVLGERLVAASISEAVASARQVKTVKVYLSTDSEMDEELIVSQGQKCVKADPRLVYLSISLRGKAARITCFVGEDAVASGVSADAVVRATAKVLGGSGGGSRSFAQGGGPKTEMMGEATKAVYDTVSGLVQG
ncbi:MAG: alanine--tRNA ligase [Nitrososphaerota archaeon]|nr:alanine--tRNA ligase [Nitrososphaerota archaeon]